MAKGAVAKEEIFNKMLETFEGSFMYNNGKELRINWDENGSPVQIKVTLTAAKEAVSVEGEVEHAAVAKKTVPSSNFPEPITKIAEPSAEEKQNVEDLLKALGLN